ncbi:MAG: glucose-6-phosphate isomerase, partial [Burkholderiales bacterium]
PKNTLFIIASKTFTTLETMHNARRAKAWLGGESACVGQFAAITANVSAAREFGIVEENIFPIWDWVGGRFSLWSAMGLSAAIAMGEEAFDAMLAGAHRMDEHFQSAPPAANMPVLLALLSIWNINFRGALSHAILPYSHALRRLPAYLQQLEMESNGKRVDRTGQVLDYHTAPVIWGSEGSVSQHSFHQLLHQGTQEIPVDFIIPLDAPGERASRELLIGNAVAQGAALLSGTPAGTTAHSVSPGNRPSTTLLLDRLSPERLGQLLALYEHKVFVQGIIWNINSFDQWGVELGKTLANNIASGKSATMLDPSTRELLQRIRHE